MDLRFGIGQLRWETSLEALKARFPNARHYKAYEGTRMGEGRFVGERLELRMLIETPQLHCGGFVEFERDRATIRAVSFSVGADECSAGLEGLPAVLCELLGLASLAHDHIANYRVPGAHVRIVTYQDGHEVEVQPTYDVEN